MISGSIFLGDLFFFAFGVSFSNVYFLSEGSYPKILPITILIGYKSRV
jgi:hypothetical protein